MMYTADDKAGKGVRLRFRDTNSDVLPEHYGTRKQQRKYNMPPIPASNILLVLGFLVLVSVMIDQLGSNLPKPLRMHDIHRNPGRFISERAMNNLVKLTSLGPRPTGSFENEVLAVNLFVKEINNIVQQANPIHKIVLDVQKTSGSFPLPFLDGMTNVYRNVQNVVVKIGSQIESPHSLLINCHFDTVFDSPGGSDDGASCAIMLEILQVISRMDEPLLHNIVLLFNGAEENLMQASHGFITQHKWAKDVRAFINLEACGAGGKEILFQAGPNHPWLMKAYSESVPHPYASSLAQEIFQSGIIPGDTDFRIFRDFGHISGLDFAWSTNGYVYHTKFDNVDQIPLGTLQRTGDNILALALQMSAAPEMADVESHRAGNLIFFDVLGVFMLRWSELLGVFINLGAVALSAFSVVQNIQLATSKYIKRREYVKQLAYSLGVVLTTWLVTLLGALLIAVTLTALGRTMSWFSRPVWIVFLYACPALILPMSLLLLAARWQKSVVISPWMLFQLYYDVYQLFWTALLVMCILLQIRSGFIPLLWVIFPSAANVIHKRLFPHCKEWIYYVNESCIPIPCECNNLEPWSMHHHPDNTISTSPNRLYWKWLVFHITMTLLPLTQTLYLMLGALNLYIPIMGRSGAGSNAEVVVAMLTTTKFLLLFSSLVPLILLIRSPQKVLSFLTAIFLISMGLLVLTPLGFPYSGDPQTPTPQRYMIAHTTRVFHDASGAVSNHETGYWIVDMDQNSPRAVESLVPEVKQARLVDECDRQLFCGLPYLMPVLTFIWKTHWIPGPSPEIPQATTLQLMSIDRRLEGIHRMAFNVTGPDHIGLMLSPVAGVTLDAWSLVEGSPLPCHPKWNNRESYFVYYSCASQPEPWVFSVDLKVSDDTARTVVDVAVISHFLHGAAQRSDEFKRFVSQFPPWSTVSSWTATYESWKF